VTSSTRIRSAADLVSYEKSLDCVHCGLCLPACPTYERFGREGTSPRGRIYLLRGLAEGSVDPAAEVRRDLDLCLVCRACEPVCPSGVRFGEMMEFGRTALIEPARDGSMKDRARRFAVRRLLPHPRRVRLVGWLLWLFQRSGLHGLLKRYGVIRYFSRAAAMRDELLPRIPSFRKRRRIRRFTPAVGERRGKVAILEGCVMPVLLGDTNRACATALAGQGFDVLVPDTNTCCGALSAHFGALDVAAESALRTIRAFAALGPVDAVVIHSAGCGSVMKEYDRIVAESPQATAEDKLAAAAFAAKIRDVSEFLVEQGVRPPPGRVDARVAYADACHLAHAQGIKAAPRELLTAIPGVELVDLPRADRCCGAAGLYNALEPEDSMALLEGKMDDLGQVDADLLVTGNPGCLLQWRAGIERRGLEVDVLHPVELLARASV